MTLSSEVLAWKRKRKTIPLRPLPLPLPLLPYKHNCSSGYPILLIWLPVYSPYRHSSLMYVSTITKYGATVLFYSFFNTYISIYCNYYYHHHFDYYCYYYYYYSILYFHYCCSYFEWHQHDINKQRGISMKEKEKDYPSTSSSSSSSSSALQTQLFIWLSHPPDMATSLLAVQTQLAHVRFNNYKIWHYCFILWDCFILFFLLYIYFYLLEFLTFAVIHDIIDLFLFFIWSKAPFCT